MLAANNQTFARRKIKSLTIRILDKLKKRGKMENKSKKTAIGQMLLKSRLGSKLVDYADLLPFDETAVRLDPWSHKDTEKDLFINASFIKTPFGESIEQEPYGHMIATRGPTKHTMEHFWKMIIQQDVKVIVSLCQEANGDVYKECA